MVLHFHLGYFYVKISFFLEFSIIVSKVFFLSVSAAFRKNSKYRHLLFGRAKEKKLQVFCEGSLFVVFRIIHPWAVLSTSLWHIITEFCQKIMYVFCPRRWFKNQGRFGFKFISYSLRPQNFHLRFDR